MRNNLIFAILLVVTTACKNDITPEIAAVSKAKAQAEFYVLDAFRESLDLIPDFVATGVSPDATVVMTSSESLSNDVYPKLVTIDYGTSNQAGVNGISRRGKIQIELSQKEVMKAPFVMSFESFYINDTRLLGAIDADYTANGTKNNYALSLRDSTKCSNANGTMSWNGSLLLSQTAGETTKTVEDDVFTYQETSSGQDYEGLFFSSKTSETTMVDFSCKYLLTSGTFELTPKDKAVQKCSYSLDCDGRVKVEESKDSYLYFQL